MHVKQNEMTSEYRTLQELGDNFLSIGDLQKAQQCYEKAAICDPDQAAPYVGIGTVSQRNNLPEEAELAFRVACRLDPRCAGGYEGLGRIAQENENYEKAFQMYLKCLELDTNNLTALLGLFQVSSQMGSFAKIIHYLETYLAGHPGDTSVMFTLATLYVKEDQFEKSKTLLLETLELDSNNKDAAYLLEEVQQHLSRTMAL